MIPAHSRAEWNPSPDHLDRITSGQNGTFVTVAEYDTVMYMFRHFHTSTNMNVYVHGISYMHWPHDHGIMGQ